MPYGSVTRQVVGCLCFQSNFLFKSISDCPRCAIKACKWIFSSACKALAPEGKLGSISPSCPPALSTSHNDWERPPCLGF